MNVTTYHVCKDNRQHTGSREKCPRCTPDQRVAAENQLYLRQVTRNVEQANRIVELEKQVEELKAQLAALSKAKAEQE